ncbi:helix-turn-helix domain-containing protein [Nocardia sp. NPDC019395]|uniref:PucR family transcriptional regulator n=1 Tax=Nocardia sp. NPDC019395 TaxID=3154686 RepID=UPI0033CC85C8
MTIATPHLVNAPLARPLRSSPPPRPGIPGPLTRPAHQPDRHHPAPVRGVDNHPINGPVIALLLYLLEPTLGTGEKTDALVADLHRAVEAAVMREETADTVTAAARGAIAVTVEELRTAGLPPGHIAAYSRRLGRVREFILATATAAYHGTAPHSRSHSPTARNHSAETGGTRPAAEVVAVVALEFTATAGSTIDSPPARRISTDRIESCLAGEAGAGTLSLVTEHGGTLAVPVDGDTETRVARIIGRLRRVMRAEVTAAVLHCTRERVGDSVDEAHEMLDVVRRLGYPHGIYRFDGIALEYQVTRPGPARESLAKIASSLDGHPDLIDALLLYIRCHGSRKSTARQLHVHPNTVDYRFRRVHQITGHDPATVSGLSKLQAAIVVGAYEGGGYPGPSVPLPAAQMRARSGAVLAQKAV